MSNTALSHKGTSHARSHKEELYRCLAHTPGGMSTALRTIDVPCRVVQADQFFGGGMMPGFAAMSPHGNMGGRTVDSLLHCACMAKYCECVGECPCQMWGT